MADRLTRWEGADENGPRAVFAKEGRFPELMQEALRKLAKYEDMYEPVPPGVLGVPMTTEDIQNWLREEMRRLIKRYEEVKEKAGG